MLLGTAFFIDIFKPISLEISRYHILKVSNLRYIFIPISLIRNKNESIKSSNNRRGRG